MLGRVVREHEPAAFGAVILVAPFSNPDPTTTIPLGRWKVVIARVHAEYEVELRNIDQAEPCQFVRGRNQILIGRLENRTVLQQALQHLWIMCGSVSRSRRP